MKRIILALLFGIVVVGGAALWKYGFLSFDTGKNAATSEGYKNISYVIDGQTVVLKNGMAETESATGSASKTTTTYFGNEAKGDLNGDGKEDIAFLLTQSGGGSGTFFYVVAAFKTDAGYQGTSALYLGDRIAPQTTEIQGGEVIVNFADRKETDPMTAAPSVAVSTYAKVSGQELVEVEK
ncbi:MAG: hypothetical protein WAV21_00660 [Minisyncoccia bacterium]